MDFWTAPMGMYFGLYNEKSNFLIKGNCISILPNYIHANCTQLSNIAKACRCIYPLGRVPSLTRLCHCPLSRCFRRARRACGTFGHRVHCGWKKRQGCAFSAAIRTAIKEMAASWEAAFDCVGNALHRLVIAVASKIVGSSHGRFDLQMSSVLKHRNSRNIKLGKRSQFSPAFDLNIRFSCKSKYPCWIVR